MIRMHVCALLLSVCSLQAFSQAKITIGAPYDEVDGRWTSYFTRDGEMMTVKVSKKNEVVIHKLSTQTLMSLKMRGYKDFPKDASFERITAFHGHYYCFYSIRERNEEGLYAREIDFASGTFTGPARKIIALDEKKMSGTKTKSVFGFGAVTADKYDFYFSYDSSMLIVQYRLVPEKKRESKSFDLIGTHVFDPTLKEQWGEVITMPYTERKMEALDYAVDASANVYIAAQVFDDNDSKVKNINGNANYHIEILKIDAGTGTLTTHAVDLQGTFIRTLWLYETKQGELIGAGIYNKGLYKEDADGFILLHFDSNVKLTREGTYEIPLDLLNQYTKARTQRRNERKEEEDEAEISWLVMREVMLQDDGGVVLVGEQEHETTTKTTTTSPTGISSTSYTTIYHYGNMLIARIDAAGKLAWMKKLPKRQHGPIGPGGMSYRYVKGTGKHNFLYIDNAKNLTLSVEDSPAAYADYWRGGLLTQFQIDDKTGEVKKSSIFDTGAVEGLDPRLFNPRRLRNTAANTMIFEADRKKENVLIKVTLSE